MEKYIEEIIPKCQKEDLENFKCDFDIAGSNYWTMIPDDEVLKVVVEILTQLPIGGFWYKD